VYVEEDVAADFPTAPSKLAESAKAAAASTLGKGGRGEGGGILRCQNYYPFSNSLRSTPLCSSPTHLRMELMAKLAIQASSAGIANL
jgi:hypothetical protein